MNVLISGERGFVARSLLAVKGFYEPSVKMRTIGRSSGLTEFLGSEDKDLNFDTFIHAASAPKALGLQRYLINKELLDATLNYCSQNNVKKYVFISSGAVYQNHSGLIDEYGPIKNKETHDAYASSKITSEKQVIDFCEAHDIKWVILRLFAFSGEFLISRREFALVDFLHQAQQSGSITVKSPDTVRSYLHQFDMAHQIIAGSKFGMNEIFNVGSDLPVNMSELAEMIKSEANTPIRIIKTSISPGNFYVPRIEKITALTKSMEHIDLRAAIRSMFAEIRQIA
jgi:nucleoside-diphosphate-sugar epimerase